MTCRARLCVCYVYATSDNECCAAAHLAWQTVPVSRTLEHRCHGRHQLILQLQHPTFDAAKRFLHRVTLKACFGQRQ